MSANNVKHAHHPNEASSASPLNVRGITKDLKALRESHPARKWWTGSGKRTPLMEAILKSRGQLISEQH